MFDYENKFVLSTYILTETRQKTLEASIGIATKGIFYSEVGLTQ